MIRNILIKRTFAIDHAAINLLNKPLSQIDPEIFQIIQKEKSRQRNSINLIPSENFTSKAVMDALGSPMQNKYSEGYPGNRYYGGNQFIDQAEILCQQRALDLFELESGKWGVNVQSLSGSPANLQTYAAVLKPHDRIMGLDLPHGGHLSHGYQTDSKKISAVSVYFETMPYRVNEAGIIDYDALEKTAGLFRPKIIVAGASAYPRFFDYERMKKICDGFAHISGLIAARVHPSPFEFADMVTTTTHKSLRGPRGAMIFFRKGVRKVEKGKEIMYDLEEKINFSVFPGHQGGPHNHTISALAVALKQAKTKEFREYQERVVSNCLSFAKELDNLGYFLVSGGTENHLLLLNLRKTGTDGARVEKILEAVNIATNKNTIPGDKSAMVPGGLRMGTPAMTTRGFCEDDFKKVAKFVHRGIEITKSVSKGVNGTKVKDFHEAVKNGAGKSEIEELREEVIDFCRLFPTVGYTVDEMNYKAN